MSASVSGSPACAAMYSSARRTQPGARRGGGACKISDPLFHVLARRLVSSVSRSVASQIAELPGRSTSRL